jgi:hypothetical protein
MLPTDVAIQLQTQLTALGYNPGILDGIVGRKTLLALQNYLFERCFRSNKDTNLTSIPPNSLELVLKDTPRVRILDLSRYQDGNPGKYADLKPAIGSGITGFIIKCGGAEASNGTVMYEDPEFDFYFQEAARLKAPRGVYFFHNFKQDPIKQAEKMFSITGKLQIGDMWPVLDVENRSNPFPGTGEQAHVVATLQKMHELYGVLPRIYTSKGVWAENGADTQENPIKEYPCWVAAYGTRKPERRVPSCYPNGTWEMWQMGFDNNMPGFGNDVDRNLYNGDLKKFRDALIQSEV